MFCVYSISMIDLFLFIHTSVYLHKLFGGLDMGTRGSMTFKIHSPSGLGILRHTALMPVS